MTTLTLKSDQQAALDALRSFARSAQLKGPALAFGEQVGRPYNPDPFGETPCICLRIAKEHDGVGMSGQLDALLK